MANGPEQSPQFEDESHRHRRELIEHVSSLYEFAEKRDAHDRYSQFAGEQYFVRNMPEMDDPVMERLLMRPAAFESPIYNIRELYVYTPLSKEVYWDEGKPRYVFLRVVTGHQPEIFFGISEEEFVRFPLGKKPKLEPKVTEDSAAFVFAYDEAAKSDDNIREGLDEEYGDTEFDEFYRFNELLVLAECVRNYRLYAQAVPRDDTPPSGLSL